MGDSKPDVCDQSDRIAPERWPGDRPDLDEIDDDLPLEFDDAFWDAFAPDDDYESLPERGDFWTDQDAA